MNKLFVCVCATAISSLCSHYLCAANLAGTEVQQRLTTLDRKAKLEAIVNQRAGGFVERPGTAKGEVVYVNCQKKAPKEWIAESIAYFSEITRFKIKYTEGEFDLKNPKIEGNVSLFIIEDEALPSLLVAPEGKWAFVNIAPIGREKRLAFFEARTKKELSRAFAYLCGATGSKFERPLTRCITDLSDLDKNPDYELPMDIVQRFWDYMKPVGVVAAQRATYLKACQDGWAAQPTNDVQKAIWDKVHAMPTEPIKIKPETKKVKE